MSRLLAIESATDFLSVALLEDERLIAERSSPERAGHTTTLLPLLDGMLAEAGIGLDEVDALAVSTGPGSFTSVRIGLATVKGLALSRDLPAIGVSTLEAMALASLAEAAPGTSALALLDARRGQWYAGTWSAPEAPGALPGPLLAEGLYSSEGLAASVGPIGILVSPEPAERLAPLRASGLEAARVVDGSAGRPQAAWVARLAALRRARGGGGSAAALAARYLRRAEAEAKRLGSPVERGVALDVDRR